MMKDFDENFLFMYIYPSIKDKQRITSLDNERICETIWFRYLYPFIIGNFYEQMLTKPGQGS